MKETSVNINKSIQSISVYLVHRISQEYHCQEEVALKSLLKTMTYDLLQERKTGLYAESLEHIWSMLLKKGNGNLEAWIHK